MASVVVLGAGMAGVAAALALQERGHDVALVDRGQPGHETSFGNAGIIQAEAVEPYAMPLAPARLAAIALGRSSEVQWSWAGLLPQARAVAGYAWHSRPRGHRAAIAAYAGLIRQATAAHDVWIKAAGADDLIRRDGYVELHRSARSFDAGAAMVARLARDHGVAGQMLDAAALRAAEPALRPDAAITGGTHWQDSWTVSDPAGLVAAYAALFVRRGGQVVAGDAMTLARDGAGWRVAGQGAQHAVIALGPWSPALAARFGLRVAMLHKRGYHRHYAAAPMPRMTLFDMASSVVLAPMRAGLRICTAADLRPAAAADPAQLRRGVAAAAGLLALGAPVEAAPWTGLRPCMPDMLPVVGAVPGQPGLWAHFGHGHHGLTLPPVTAGLLADAIEGRAAPALSPARLR